MLTTTVIRSRNLLLWLLCFCLVAFFSQHLFAENTLAEDERQPAIPGEINSGVKLNSSGLVMSADGRWLCVSGGGTGLVDLKSGEIRKLGDRNEYWSLMIADMPTSSWSPAEPLLAFKLYREGRSFLSAWSPGDEAVRDLMAFPRDMYNSLSVAPVWSADGKTIYVLVKKDLPWPKSHPDDDYPPTASENAKLKITEHYGVSVKRRRFEKEYEDAYAESKRSLIMAIDVATGRAGMLAKGNDIASVYLSPDGRRLVAVQIKTDVPGKPTKWTNQVYADMYLLDTAAVADLPTIDLEEMDDRRAGWFDHKGRRLNPISSDVHLNNPALPYNRVANMFGTNGNPLVSWSPDSQRFAYATVGRESTGDLFIYDVASAELHNLTGQLDLPESPKSLGYGGHYTWEFNSLKFGNTYPPLWLPDGKSLVAVGRGDAWQIPLKRNKKPRLLTRDLPQEVNRIIPAYQQNTAALDADGRLTLIAKDKQSRMDSLWKLDVGKRRSEKLADTGVWVNVMAVTDTAGERLVYTGQTTESEKNVYQVVGARAPQLVTQFRLELAQRRYPESRVLTWQTESGETAYGLLYLPENASAANKVPMILDGYPGQIDSRLDVRAQKGAAFFDDALYGLLQEGIAVLYPDIELSDQGVYERPMQQINEAVLRATEAALATKVIDADRLGIMGSSYGGYMVQAVITQTDRFKAAISRAGLSNLYGGYAAGGSFSRKWSEIGQGRMGLPPWEDPQRYTDNSPLSYFDKIETPLLLIHGEGDRTVPVEMSRESFRALERLNNPTVFATYRRQGHRSTQEVNRRERLWFLEHLMDGDAVSGLADQGSFFLGGDLKQDKLLTD